MKKVFSLLLCTTAMLFAKQSDTCYSIQLKSFKLKENSNYDFKLHKYPKKCKYISFGEIKTIRCGCYDTYPRSRKELAKLKKKYKNAMIVRSYRYRFIPLVKHTKIQQPTLNAKAKQKKLQRVAKAKQKTSQITTNLSTQEIPQEDFFDYLTTQGNINITGQSYLKKPQGKNPQNLLISANLEANYQKENFSVKSKLHAQADYYDTKGSAKHTNRTFLRLDELYGEYNFDDDSVGFGKNIQFWGALELRNIANVFNPDELRNDPFYTDKLGVINFNYTHYTESGELSLYVKLYEQNREMAYYPYVYYFFPQNVSVAPGVSYPLLYNKELQTKASRYRPSIYLKYSDTTDTEYALDYTFIYENGYDSQRYYDTKLLPDNTFSTQENAYLVNKFITYDTLVIGPTLYKLEALYANIIDDPTVSDYIHIGAGIEYTLTQIYKEADLGLLVEYYNYTTLQSSKRTDLELFELFEDDLFLGLRYSFNEGDDSSIIGGAVFDMQYDEQFYYMEYTARLFDTLKVNFDYRYIEPSRTKPTAFHLMGKHERISLKLGYYF